LGEIVGLSNKDVSLERFQLHIHRQWIDKEQAYGPTKVRKERVVSFDSELGLREMRYAHLSQSHQKVPTLSWAVEKNKNFPRLIHASKQASIQKTI